MKLITCCFILTVKKKLLVKHLKVTVIEIVIGLTFFSPSLLCLKLLWEMEKMLVGDVYAEDEAQHAYLSVSHCGPQCIHL